MLSYSCREIPQSLDFPAVLKIGKTLATYASILQARIRVQLCACMCTWHGTLLTGNRRIGTLFQVLHVNHIGLKAKPVDRLLPQHTVIVIQTRIRKT
jgi:hypothetical protein